MNTLETKRYDLINQGYGVYLGECPPANEMQSVSDRDRTLFWSVVEKKYLVFERTRVVGNALFRLKLIKNIL